MAKKDPEHDTLQILLSHYQAWTDDNEIRRTREGGWNDVTDAYWGRLPDDWPYESRVVDPRIRTSIIDKDARLINNRLRGRFVPRESGDMLGARINNIFIDFQWDTATWGGTMENKLLISSQDARMYASKFARIPWMVREDGEGNIVFEGNEFEPLDIRDCGMDFAAKSVKDAKWFQYREWVYLEDLQDHNRSTSPEASFKNLDKIAGDLRDKKTVKGGGDQRSNRYSSRIKELKGLQDRLGQDMAFPIVELVHEYRSDCWYTFAPAHGEILREIKNPYKHRRIPIVQLRYYPLQDDPMGESEVEPVLPLWKAIQATVCAYLDEVNIKMRPPVKIIEGQARIETIVYLPEAQWLVNRQDAVEEMRSDSGGITNYFQTSYSSLVSAFNTAMGDLSQGTSAADPLSNDKTATEIKQVQKQQNVRDERNQLILSQFIQDFVQMWLSNNQQFLFSDPKKQDFVMRVLGSDQYEYFKRSGLDGMEVTDESMQEIQEIIALQDGNVSDGDIAEMYEAAKTPKFPVKRGKDTVPKMKISEMGDDAELIVVPEDIAGAYDYVPDVKSMQSGADADLQQGNLRAMEMLTGNPQVLQQLQAEGYKVKIKDLIISVLESQGNKDAERFFEKVEAPAPMPGMTADGQPQMPNVDVTGGMGMPEDMTGGTMPMGAQMGMQ